jgi:hypothetical protein
MAQRAEPLRRCGPAGVLVPRRPGVAMLASTSTARMVTMPSVNSAATPSGSSQLPRSPASPGTGTVRVRMYPAAARKQTRPLNPQAAEDGSEQGEARRQPGGAAALALDLQDMDDADRDEPDRGCGAHRGIERQGRPLESGGQACGNPGQPAARHALTPFRYGRVTGTALRATRGARG